MRYLFKFLIILGYLLFGYFWIQSCYQVITRNIIVEIFDFNRTSVSSYSFTNKANGSEKVILNYIYQVDETTFSNELYINKEAFKNKVGLDKENLTVMYNTKFPEVSFIEGWELQSFYKIKLLLFSIFLGIVVLGSLFLKAENKRLKSLSRSNT